MSQRSPRTSPTTRTLATLLSRANALPLQFRRRRSSTSQHKRYYTRKKPTDPFFFPTTVMPLTGLGINAIEMSPPPPGDDFQTLKLSSCRPARRKCYKCAVPATLFLPLRYMFFSIDRG